MLKVILFFSNHFEYDIYRPVNLQILQWEVVQEGCLKREKNKTKQVRFFGVNPISTWEGGIKFVGAVFSFP